MRAVNGGEFGEISKFFTICSKIWRWVYICSQRRVEDNTPRFTLRHRVPDDILRKYCEELDSAVEAVVEAGVVDEFIVYDNDADDGFVQDSRARWGSAADDVWRASRQRGAGVRWCRTPSGELPDAPL